MLLYLSAVWPNIIFPLQQIARQRARGKRGVERRPARRLRAQVSRQEARRRIHGRDIPQRHRGVAQESGTVLRRGTCKLKIHEISFGSHGKG